MESSRIRVGRQSVSTMRGARSSYPNTTSTNGRTPSFTGSGKPGVFGYCFIPPGLFAQIKAKFLELARQNKSGAVRR
jgi:hypothetical protein